MILVDHDFDFGSERSSAKSKSFDREVFKGLGLIEKRSLGEIEDLEKSGRD